MNFKHGALAGALLSLGVFPAHAAYQMRAIAVENLSTWTVAPTSYGEWVEQGGRYGCDLWTPDESSVTAGQSFIQNRSCNQNQTRTVQSREYDSFSGAFRVTSTQTESRVVSKLETRQSIGGVSTETSSSANHSSTSGNLSSNASSSQNQQASSTASSITTSQSPVENTGSSTGNAASSSSSSSAGGTGGGGGGGGGGSWVSAAPLISTWETVSVTSGEWTPSASNQVSGFTQIKNTVELQERFVQQREYDLATSKFRDVGSPVRETQNVSTDENRFVSVTSNAPVENSKDCSEWAPGPETVNYGTSFTQSRSCQVATSVTYNFSIGGSWTNSLNGNTNESRQSVGTLQSWIPTSSSFTAWADTGSAYGYSAWSPVVSNQQTSFTQTRNYSQDQARQEQPREIDTVSGQIRNVGSPIDRSQTLSKSENRSVTVTSSAWANTTQTNVSAWLPVYGTQTANYTQSQSFTQNKSRTWTYTAPDASILGTYTENSSDPSSQDRSIAVTSDAWVNSGAPYGCTAWSPDVSTVNAGQTFTQTRTCSQDQTKTWTHKLSGTTVYTRNENQTLTGVSGSQQATGTKTAAVCRFYEASHRQDAGYGPYTYWFKGSWYVKGSMVGSSSASSITVSNVTYTRGVSIYLSGGYPVEEICF